MITKEDLKPNKISEPFEMKILTFILGTPDEIAKAIIDEKWEEMIKNSKFPEYNPDWANVAKKGLIGLQDHGDDVWFRNIKIKEM